MTGAAASSGPSPDAVANRLARVNTGLYLAGYAVLFVGMAWATWTHGFLAGVTAAVALWGVVAGPVLDLTTRTRFRSDRNLASLREVVRSFEYPFAAILLARGTVLDSEQTPDGRVATLRVTMLRMFSGEYELRMTETDGGARFTLATDETKLVEATVTVEDSDGGAEVTQTVRRCTPSRPRRLVLAAATSRIERRFWARAGFEMVDSETNVGLWHL